MSFCDLYATSQFCAIGNWVYIIGQISLGMIMGLILGGILGTLKN